MNKYADAQKTDVLIYVEDAGAANCIAQLPQSLKKSDVSSVLLSQGFAYDLLLSRRISTKKLAWDTTASHILERFNPKIVLVGTSENPDSLELKLIEVAKDSKIMSAAIVDMAINADKRFAGRSTTPLRYAPDWLLVPNVMTAQSYVELGYDNNHLIICGHPHYDYLFSLKEELDQKDLLKLRRRLFPFIQGNANANQKVLVFIAEPPSVLNPEASLRSDNYTLQGRGGSTNRNDIVLEEVLECLACLKTPCDFAKPYFVVRLHPKNTADQFAAYQVEEVDYFSVGGDPLEVVWAADYVMGMSSMLMEEAALLAKPVLAALPSLQEKSRLAGIEGGLISCVTTKEELKVAIADLLRFPAKYVVKNPEHVFKRGALRRVTDFLLQHLRVEIGKN